MLQLMAQQKRWSAAFSNRTLPCVLVTTSDTQANQNQSNSECCAAMAKNGRKCEPAVANDTESETKVS